MFVLHVTNKHLGSNLDRSGRRRQRILRHPRRRELPLANGPIRAYGRLLHPSHQRR